MQRYTISWQSDSRISLEENGKEVYRLEREDSGRGIWALYPVVNDRLGAKIDRDQYANDLIERVCARLIQPGQIIPVPGGYVVQAPVEAEDFYVSGTGYLCCRHPVRIVLSEKSVLPLGIQSRHQLRPATKGELALAGLAQAGASAGVFMAP